MTCFCFSLLGQDHITLLLTCYTKIKDEGKISHLIDGIFSTVAPAKAAAAAAAAKSSTFNADQAIAALQTAGYTAHALKVAARYYRHHAYIDIQVRDQCSALKWSCNN